MKEERLKEAAKGVSPVDQVIGQKLRELRVIKGLNQHDLGGQLGISAQQIQKYEAGVNRVSASRLYNLARLFDIKISYFFHDCQNDRTVPQEVLDSHALVSSFAKIKDPKTREGVLKLIKSLSSDNDGNA